MAWDVFHLWRDDIVLGAPHQQARLAGVCSRDSFQFGDDRTLHGFVRLLVALLDDEDPPAGSQRKLVAACWFCNSE